MEIITPSERTFIADQNGTFISSIGLSYAKLWAFECENTWYTYTAHKFQMHRTSGSVHHRTVA